MNKKERKKENFAVHLKKENKRIDFFGMEEDFSHTRTLYYCKDTHTRLTTIRKKKSYSRINHRRKRKKEKSAHILSSEHKRLREKRG